MSQPPAFGRRRPPAATVPARRAPPAATPPHPAASIPAESFSSPEALAPAAEALRAELAAARRGQGGDFADWRRSQRGGRVLMWLMTLLLISPGLICFLYDLPPMVSLGVEAAGIAGNAWLRRARRRHLKAIAQWGEPPGEA